MEPADPTATAADRVIRAITDDGAFRVIALRTTDTVRDALAHQEGVAGVTARNFGDLMTGAILVRETMAPPLRVQLVLQGTHGRLVADSHPGGTSRGMVQREDASLDIELHRESVLQVMRVMPNGQLHQGIVDAWQDQGLSGALMTYMQTSEQVTSTIGVACVLEGDEVRAAGGFIVQLLPEVSEAPLAIMTERLADFRDIGALLVADDADPTALIRELLYGFPHTILAESPLRFGCLCSAARVLGAMATLGREEIEKIVAKGEVLDIDCDWCGKHYQVASTQLATLLDAN